MKTKLFLIVLITTLFNKIAVSQTTTDCLKDFDYLVKKIQTDYPGYQDKVTSDNHTQLTLLENEIRRKISRNPDSCGYYLSEYTGFFKDNHLRVRYIGKATNELAEIMEVSSYGKNLSVNTDSLHQATKNTKTIEGVWEGYRQKFAVSKDGQKYVGVVINKQGWKSGQILYEFEAINDTAFCIINHSLIKDRSTYMSKASLHVNGRIIEIHGDTKFVRKSDSDIFDKAFLYSYMPLYPNGTNIYPIAMNLSDSTYYLRIVSFEDEDANDIVVQCWNEIMARPNLIIDIRYNGGGQDIYYQELAKLIYTKPYESKGVEWYASKGNIESFENTIKRGDILDGEEGLKWIQTLVEAMKKNVGSFVTHPDDTNDIVEMDIVYTTPRNVGIIINEHIASSAEQFLLDAKESDKVILFGNRNTAGVLDYSNVTPTSLPSNNFQLWCPKTRSKRLPENPIDNIGIAPDVIIPFPATEQLFDKLDDWVYFVKNYLELKN